MPVIDYACESGVELHGEVFDAIVSGLKEVGIADALTATSVVSSLVSAGILIRDGQRGTASLSILSAVSALTAGIMHNGPGKVKPDEIMQFLYKFLSKNAVPPAQGQPAQPATAAPQAAAPERTPPDDPFDHDDFDITHLFETNEDRPRAGMVPIGGNYIRDYYYAPDPPVANNPGAAAAGLNHRGAVANDPDNDPISAIPVAQRTTKRPKLANDTISPSQAALTILRKACAAASQVARVGVSRDKVKSHIANELLASASSMVAKGVIPSYPDSPPVAIEDGVTWTVRSRTQRNINDLRSLFAHANFGTTFSTTAWFDELYQRHREASQAEADARGVHVDKIAIERLAAQLPSWPRDPVVPLCVYDQPGYAIHPAKMPALRLFCYARTIMPHAAPDITRLTQVAVSGITIVCLAASRFGGFCMSDVTKLISEKNILHKEFTDIKEFVSDCVYEWFGVAISPSAEHQKNMASLIQEAAPLSLLSTQDIYIGDNIDKLKAWVERAESMCVTSRSIPALATSPGYMIIVKLLGELRDKLLTAKRRIDNPGFRQEPVVIHWNGAPGVGKTSLATFFARHIVANRPEIKPGIYSVKLGNSQYFPAYSGQDIFFCDEAFSHKKDLFFLHGNSIMSTGDARMEGASLPEKEQWCQAKFIFLMSNTPRCEIEGMTVEATRAFWSRLDTVEVSFPQQDPANPRGLQNRRPDFSHLRLVKTTYDENGGAYDVDEETPISLREHLAEVLAKYDANKAHFEAELARRNNPDGDIPPLPNNIPQVGVHLHGASPPFTIGMFGDMGAGKSHSSNELVHRLSNLFSMDVLRAMSIQELMIPRQRPTICVIDDLITDDNVDEYMRAWDHADTKDIFVITSNMSLFCGRTLTNWKLPILGIRIPWYRRMVTVSCNVGTHQGFLRRIGLSGMLKACDSPPVAVTPHEAHGLAYRFEKKDLVRRSFLVRDGRETPCEVSEHFDTVAGEIIQHRAKGGSLVTTFNGPRLAREYDITISCPSVPILFDLLKDSTRFAAALAGLASDGTTVMIKPGLVNKAAAISDMSNWEVADGDLSGEHLLRVVSTVALRLYTSGVNIAVSISAGSIHVEAAGNVVNVTGLQDVTNATGHISTDGHITVHFEGRYPITMTTHAWACLMEGIVNEEALPYPATSLAAAKTYLQSTIGTQTDPISHHVAESVRQSAEAKVRLVTSQSYQLALATLRKYPVVIAAITFLVAGSLVAVVGSKMMGSTPEYIVTLESLEKLARKKSRKFTTAERASAHLAFRLYADSGDASYASAPLRYPNCWEHAFGKPPCDDSSIIDKSCKLLAENVELMGKRINFKSFTSGKTLSEYLPEEQVAIRTRARAYEFNRRDREDYILNVEDFADRGGSASNYITACANGDGIATYSGFEKYMRSVQTHGVSSVSWGNPIPIDSLVENVNKATVVVRDRHYNNGALGLHINDGYILSIAHPFSKPGALVDVTRDVSSSGVTVPQSFTAKIISINRKTELALFKIQDPKWQPMPSMESKLAPVQSTHVTAGVVVRPTTRGRTLSKKHLVFNCESRSFQQPGTGSEAPLSFSGHAYVTAYVAPDGTAVGEHGDCGMVMIGGENWRNAETICGMYIGRKDGNALFVPVSTLHYNELLSDCVETHGMVDPREVVVGGRTVVMDDYTDAAIRDRKNPHYDFSELLKTSECGGTVGYLKSMIFTERKNEKPCRTSTGINVEPLTSLKVPTPVSSASVEDKSQMVPVPAGRKAGSCELVYSNASGQFHKRKTVPSKYWDKAAEHLFQALPPLCRSFRRKTIMEALNGVYNVDPCSKSVRSSINIHSAPGWYYTERYGMTDKSRFFRGSKINGTWVPDRPLVIDTSRPEGADLLGRLKNIQDLARQGKTLACIASTFFKRELITAEKARIGKVRTCEAMDFAFNLWVNMNFSDFYERRRNQMDGQHMVIGTDFRCNSTSLVEDLQSYNPNYVIAADVSKWDRNAPREVTHYSAVVLGMAAKESPNYDGKEHVDNEIRALQQYFGYPISIIGDCVYWTDGRMSSGYFFTSEFNSDGHYMMLAATALQIHEEKTGAMPRYDLLRGCAMVKIYGDDMIMAAKPESFMTPEVVTEIYKRNGFDATNSTKTGPVCLETLETATFCSRTFIPDSSKNFYFGAIKKEAIVNWLKWVTVPTPEFIANNMRLAMQESVPWGPEFFHQIQKIIRMHMHLVGGEEVMFYSYDDGLYAWEQMVRGCNTANVEDILRGTALEDLGAQPNFRIEDESEFVETHGLTPILSSSPTVLPLTRQKMYYRRREQCSTACLVAYNPLSSRWMRSVVNSNWTVRPGTTNRLVMPRCVQKECAKLLSLLYRSMESTEQFTMNSAIFTDDGRLCRPITFTCPEPLKHVGKDHDLTNCATCSMIMGSLVFEMALPDCSCQPRSVASQVMSLFSSSMALPATPICVTPTVDDAHQCRLVEKITPISNLRAVITSEPYTEPTSETNVELHGLMDDSGAPPMATSLPTDVVQPLTEGDGGVISQSEGVAAVYDFRNVTSGQPTAFAAIAGSQKSHLEVASQIFVNSHNEPRRITSAVKAGTVLEVFRLKDTALFSSFMKEQIALHEIWAGSPEYQVQFHGPATTGGSVRFTWLPYTERAGTVVQLSSIAQFPSMLVPLGGSADVRVGIPDSKMSISVNTVDDLIAGNAAGPCVIMTLEQPVNNGYSNAESNMVHVTYNVRSRFGDQFYMGRARAQRATPQWMGDVIGRTLGDLAQTSALLTLQECATLAPDIDRDVMDVGRLEYACYRDNLHYWSNTLLTDSVWSQNTASDDDIAVTRPVDGKQWIYMVTRIPFMTDSASIEKVPVKFNINQSTGAISQTGTTAEYPLRIWYKTLPEGGQTVDLAYRAESGPQVAKMQLQCIGETHCKSDPKIKMLTLTYSCQVSAGPKETILSIVNSSNAPTAFVSRSDVVFTQVNVPARPVLNKYHYVSVVERPFPVNYGAAIIPPTPVSNKLVEVLDGFYATFVDDKNSGNRFTLISHDDTLIIPGGTSLTMTVGDISKYRCQGYAPFTTTQSHDPCEAPMTSFYLTSRNQERLLDALKRPRQLTNASHSTCVFDLFAQYALHLPTSQMRRIAETLMGGGEVELHSAATSILAGALSGAGQSWGDTIKSRRQHKYAMQQMAEQFRLSLNNSEQLSKLSHNQNMELRQQLHLQAKEMADQSFGLAQLLQKEKMGYTAVGVMERAGKTDKPERPKKKSDPLDAIEKAPYLTPELNPPPHAHPEAVNFGVSLDGSRMNPGAKMVEDPVHEGLQDGSHKMVVKAEVHEPTRKADVK